MDLFPTEFSLRAEHLITPDFIAVTVYLSVFIHNCTVYMYDIRIYDLRPERLNTRGLVILVDQ